MGLLTFYCRMITPNNKGKLRRDEEIDSPYILLVEKHGEVFKEPQAYKRDEVEIPKGSHLVEIDVKEDTSVCGIFKDELATFNVINMFKVADSIQYMAKEKAGLLPEHELEQFSYRKKVCKPCLDNGSCLVCGCKTPNRLYSRAKCAGDKYPKLLNKEDWEEYKKTTD